MLDKADGLEFVQIIGKNSIVSHLSKWQGTCIQQNYDFIIRIIRVWCVNEKQLLLLLLFPSQWERQIDRWCK